MGELVENRGRKYALLTEELYKNLRNANRRTEQTQSAEFSQILALDDKIKDILTSHVPDTMKARMYAEAASDYFNLREKAPETRPAQQQMMEPLFPKVKQAPVQIENVEEKHIKKPVSATAHAVDRGSVAPHTVLQSQETQYEDPPQEEAEIFEDASASPAAFGTSSIQVSQNREQKIQDDRIDNIIDFISQHEDVVNFDPKTSNVQIYGKNWPKSNINDILSYITKKRVSKTELPPHGTGQFVVALGRAGIDPRLLPRKEIKELLPQRGMGANWISLFD